MQAYCVEHECFSSEQVGAMIQAIDATPLVGRSPLSGTFSGSRGFGAMFTRRGLAVLERRLPFASTFFRRATSRLAHRRLFSPGERLAAFICGGSPNAFYLNVLALGPGLSIGNHVDATLRPRILGGQSAAARAAVDEASLLPKLVSVLYLKVPEFQSAAASQPAAPGGELVLSHGPREVGRISPRIGSLAHFRGHLAHRVEQVGVAAVGLRLSMVCEQYVLDRPALARIPDFNLRSQGLFAARLEEAGDRSAPQWLIDGFDS